MIALLVVCALQEGNEVNVHIREDFSRRHPQKSYHTHAPVAWDSPGSRVRMRSECLQPVRTAAPPQDEDEKRPGITDLTELILPPRWNEWDPKLTRIEGGGLLAPPISFDTEDGDRDTGVMFGGMIELDFKTWRVALQWLEGDVEVDRVELVDDGRGGFVEALVETDEDLRIFAFEVAVPVFLADESEITYAVGVVAALNYLKIDDFSGAGFHAGLFAELGWSVLQIRLEAVPFLRSFDGEVESENPLFILEAGLQLRF